MGLSGNRIPKIVQLCLSSCSQKSSLLERQLISWDIHHFQTHPINGTLSIHLPFIRWVGQNQLDHLEDSGRSIPPKEPEVISCLKMHIIYISQLGKLYSGKNLIDHGILALNDLTQSLANELGLKRRNWMETSWISHIPTTSNKWAVYGSTCLQPQWNPHLLPDNFPARRVASGPWHRWELKWFIAPLPG